MVFCLAAYRCSVAPNETGHGERRVSTATGLIISIAGTAVAGLLILIVLLFSVLRQPTSTASAQSSHTASPSPSPTVSGVLVTPSSPLQVVVIPTAISVDLTGGNSGVSEWIPIVVAVIGVFGAFGSAFIGYFIQRGRNESNQGSKESSASLGCRVRRLA